MVVRVEHVHVGLGWEGRVERQAQEVYSGALAIVVNVFHEVRLGRIGCDDRAHQPAGPGFITPCQCCHALLPADVKNSSPFWAAAFAAATASPVLSAQPWL
jgi:hypothetical protein